MKVFNKKFSQIKINQNEKFNTYITEEKLKQFVSISGDKNPLHLNKKYAQHLGFKENIIHGLLISSLYSKLVGVYLPGKYAVIGKISINFHNPLYLSEKIQVSGKIISKDNRFKNIIIRAQILKKDKIISTAEILVNVKK